MRRREQPMTAEQAGDFSTVLAMPPRPSAAARLPPAPLRVRLKTSPLIRRLLPTRLMLMRAARRGAAIWDRDSGARREATVVMEAVVQGTARAGEVGELARRHVIERSIDETLQWQPWPTPAMDSDSAAHIQAALGAGRGVLLSSCHTGPFYLSVPAFSRMGVVPFTVAGPWFFQQPSHDHWGRRLAVWQKRSRSRMILSTGSFPTLAALLERGDVVFIFFDMPGRAQTRFLGKPAMLADGSARLAMQTGALILPLRTRITGLRVWLDAAAALDPHDFSDTGELHRALAEQHERWILESPAAMDDPRTFGWGDGATPAGWMPPGASEA